MTAKFKLLLKKITNLKYSTLALIIFILIVIFVSANQWIGDKSQLEEEYLNFISNESHRLEVEKSNIPFVKSAYERNTVTIQTDSLEDLFTRLQITDPQAEQFIKKNQKFYAEIVGRGNRHISVKTGPSNKIHSLIARFNKGSDIEFQRYTLNRTADGFKLKQETLPLKPKQQVVSGVINYSLFATTDKLGLPDSLTIELAELFSSYVDFNRDLRKGDYFTLVYQALLADDIVVSAGKIMSAEFVNRGRSRSAVWFADKDVAGEYFSFEGKSRKLMYLRAPLKFSRISSRFTTGRFHPILKIWRSHKGVDYAAPTGTPIRSIADGVVTFAGVQRGYGNVVYVKHPDTNVTVYGHMSKIKTTKGAKVLQGDIIGLVGATGWATGPHLHFEIRIKGVQVDPLNIINKDIPNTKSVENNANFKLLSEKMQQLQLPYAEQAKLEASTKNITEIQSVVSREDLDKNSSEVKDDTKMQAQLDFESQYKEDTNIKANVITKSIADANAQAQIDANAKIQSNAITKAKANYISKSKEYTTKDISNDNQ